MNRGLRLARCARLIRPPVSQPILRPPCRRGYARMLSSPAKAEYTWGLPWQILTPLLILTTGGLAMAIWTFSSTEFLDSGFPPRAAEALRIASVAADDGQLRHAIKYYRLGIEEAIAGGMGPFDERILRIKGRLMGVIRRE